MLSCCLRHNAFLLGLFSDHEYGGDLYLQNSVDLHRTMRGYILQDRILRSYSCENISSCHELTLFKNRNKMSRREDE
jgi:hypothetical protein